MKVWKKDVMGRERGRVNKSYEKIVKKCKPQSKIRFCNRKTNTSEIILNINVCWTYTLERLFQPIQSNKLVTKNRVSTERASKMPTAEVFLILLFPLGLGYVAGDFPPQQLMISWTDFELILEKNPRSHLNKLRHSEHSPPTTQEGG